MSPRSEEFMASAREHLAAAHAGFREGLRGPVVSAAYYAMFFAARAALSEEDKYAKTHQGTWHVFRETFVKVGRFDERLTAEAQDALRLRIGADYQAMRFARDEVAGVVSLAERFVAEVEKMFD